MSSTSVQEKFRGVGNAEGVKVWQVQKFDLVEVPANQQGSFYTGDSYLVLHSYKDATGKIRHNVFFWLGKETTQDEAGSDAFFATQLDEALGGAPVQHREVQGEESEAFLKLFPRIQYLQGGTASGFRKVEAKVHACKLFHISSPASGSSTRMTEVALAPSSLKPDDSFVLDAGETVYVYNGPRCSVREKSKASQVASELRSGRSSKMVVVEPDDSSSAEAQAFYKLLGA